MSTTFSSLLLGTGSKGAYGKYNAGFIQQCLTQSVFETLRNLWAKYTFEGKELRFLELLVFSSVLFVLISHLSISRLFKSSRGHMRT